MPAIPDIPLLLFMLLCIAACWRFRWRDYLLTSAKCPKEQPADRPHPLKSPPKISIVIPNHNQGTRLCENLPALLSQDYPDYEIIICDEASDDGTPSLLEPILENHPHIRLRVIPNTSRGVSLRKLSITLGVRAARGEWIVLTTPDARPLSDQWLTTLSQSFQDKTQMVLGLVVYSPEEAKRNIHAQFRRLRYQQMNHRAARHGMPFTCDLSNTAFLKNMFMSAGGFTCGLHSTCAEGEWLLRAFSAHHKGATDTFARIVTAPSGHVVQDFPPSILQHSLCVTHREALRHLTFRGKKFLLREGCASFAHVLFTGGAITYLLPHIPMDWEGTSLTTGIYHGCFLLMLILLWFLPFVLLLKSSRFSGWNSFRLANPFHALWQPLRNFLWKYERWKLRKDFRIRS